MEIKMNNASYTYNENTSLSKKAVEDINIEFKSGTINGIVGSSGSGKSTILELINALIVPNKGKIEIDSRILTKKRKIKNINQLRHKIGFVFQNPDEQFFASTVKKEIEFSMKYFHKKTQNIEKHISDALKMVELDDSYLSRDPLSLSSGEKRKVAIASVLAYNPKVVMLDEPTIGLDNKSKNNLIKIIKLLKNRYKKTVIIISNDTDFLLKISDYVVVLNNGKIVLDGDKYEVFTNDSLKEYGVKVPKIIEFEKLVREKKKVRILYRDEINDLMKDVYRHVT